MRVAYVVESDVFGGAERYLEHLVGLRPPGWDATLVACGNAPPELLDGLGADAEVVVVPRPRRKSDVRGLAALARTLRRLGPDLVHVNQATATNARHALAAGRGMPLVTTLHVHVPISHAVQRRLLGALYRGVDAAIGVSEEIVDQLRSLGVPGPRVHRIHNGVPVRRAGSGPRGSGGGSPVIGCVGRLTEQKGLDLLIDAIAHLGRPDLRLRVAGDGPLRSALEARARRAGVAVEFLGHVPPLELLESVDLYCLPSRWEGLPFALLEAMSEGLPCLVTDVGDVAEAVADAAVVVPPGDARTLADALRSLVDDPSARARLGAAARDRARDRLSAEMMARRTFAVYDRVLEGSR